MAGLGRKTWSALEVVTAANVQGYLQDQVVQVYAGTAAAGSALGTAVSEGMVRYLSDSKEIHKYTGSSWEGIAPVSGNAIINGAFDIWARGTSIAVTTGTSNNYTVDRWAMSVGANQASTVSRQSTNDSVNLPNIQYCARVQRNSGQTGTGQMYFDQCLETVNSIPFSGKNITVSFYARAGANFSASSNILTFQIVTGTGTDQNISTASGIAVAGASNFTLSSTWQRFSLTASVASSVTQLFLRSQVSPTGTAGAADYYEITGVQLEAGSVATPFRRNANSIQGELAACQRYYWRISSSQAYASLTQIGTGQNSTTAWLYVKHPVTMRTRPTSMDFTTTYSRYDIYDHAGGVQQVTALAYDAAHTTTEQGVIMATTGGGLTAYRPYVLIVDVSGSGEAYIGFSAEL